MPPLKGRVHNGRLVLDEPTDLPEGAEVELAVVDEGDDMDETERARLHESSRRSIAQAKAGQLQMKLGTRLAAASLVLGAVSACARPSLDDGPEMDHARPSTDEAPISLGLVHMDGAAKPEEQFPYCSGKAKPVYGVTAGCYEGGGVQKGADGKPEIATVLLAAASVAVYVSERHFFDGQLWRSTVQEHRAPW